MEVASLVPMPGQEGGSCQSGSCEAVLVLRCRVRHVQVGEDGAAPRGRTVRLSRMQTASAGPRSYGQIRGPALAWCLFRDRFVGDIRLHGRNTFQCIADNGELSCGTHALYEPAPSLVTPVMCGDRLAARQRSVRCPIRERPLPCLPLKIKTRPPAAAALSSGDRSDLRPGRSCSEGCA